MNAFAMTFLLLNVLLLLFLPRRWAPLPFLIGACYITCNQMIEVGPLHFSVIRILVVAGLVRVMIRRESLSGGMNGLDKLMLVWALWAVISSIFHKDATVALIYVLGFVYDALGIYFLLRSFCQTFEDVEWLCRLTAVLLVPVALEMIYEKLTDSNLFYELVGQTKDLYVREGRIRAQGPFGHAILGGTVGAVCLPLMIPLWYKHHKEALIGIGACLVMIITSASSGPIVSTMAALAALYMWRYRDSMSFVRWSLVASYIALDVVMKDPAYFVMAHIDLAGGSTGWHRARLIQSAISHLPEWWIGGTDYTRHWMPTGVSWSMNHTDITNYYLQMGVIGGLPLMILFMYILAKGFQFVGQTQRLPVEMPRESRVMVWTLGASLFAHAVTFISVAYFDQSFVFLYLTLAAIGSVGSAAAQFDAAHSQNIMEKATPRPRSRKAWPISTARAGDALLPREAAASRSIAEGVHHAGIIPGKIHHT